MKAFIMIVLVVLWVVLFLCNRIILKQNNCLSKLLTESDRKYLDLLHDVRNQPESYNLESGAIIVEVYAIHVSEGNIVRSLVKRFDTDDFDYNHLCAEELLDTLKAKA